MTHKNQKGQLLKDNGRGFTAENITETEPCDETCVDWPRDPKDKTKRCGYCIPESLLANQKRTKT